MIDSIHEPKKSILIANKEQIKHIDSANSQAACVIKQSDASDEHSYSHGIRANRSGLPVTPSLVYQDDGFEATRIPTTPRMREADSQHTQSSKRDEQELNLFTECDMFCDASCAASQYCPLPDLHDDHSCSNLDIMQRGPSSSTQDRQNVNNCLPGIINTNATASTPGFIGKEPAHRGDSTLVQTFKRRRNGEFDVTSIHPCYSGNCDITLLNTPKRPSKLKSSASAHISQGIKTALPLKIINQLEYVSIEDIRDDAQLDSHIGSETFRLPGFNTEKIASSLSSHSSSLVSPLFPSSEFLERTARAPILQFPSDKLHQQSFQSLSAPSIPKTMSRNTQILFGVNCDSMPTANKAGHETQCKKRDNHVKPENQPDLLSLLPDDRNYVKPTCDSRDVGKLSWRETSQTRPILYKAKSYATSMESQDPSTFIMPMHTFTPPSSTSSNGSSLNPNFHPAFAVGSEHVKTLPTKVPSRSIHHATFTTERPNSGTSTNINPELELSVSSEISSSVLSSPFQRSSALQSPSPFDNVSIMKGTLSMQPRGPHCHVEAPQKIGALHAFSSQETLKRSSPFLVSQSANAQVLNRGQYPHPCAKGSVLDTEGLNEQHPVPNKISSRYLEYVSSAQRNTAPSKQLTGKFCNTFFFLNIDFIIYFVFCFFCFLFLFSSSFLCTVHTLCKVDICDISFFFTLAFIFSRHSKILPPSGLFIIFFIFYSSISFSFLLLSSSLSSVIDFTNIVKILQCPSMI